jgi:hypothetical protein
MNSSPILRIDPILHFWIDAGIPDIELCGLAAGEMLAERLQKLEEMGFAMRYLDSDGQIGWKASPSMLGHLAGLQRDAEDELNDDR